MLTCIERAFYLNLYGLKIVKEVIPLVFLSAEAYIANSNHRNEHAMKRVVKQYPLNHIELN